MLLHQHPALEYIMWQGLVITKQIATDEKKVDNETGEETTVYKTESYIIEDNKTDKKYVYWDEREPYSLQVSDEWVVSNSTTKLIFINDKGEGTEVPHDDIDYYYTDKGSSSGGGALIGKMLGEFDEINGKYFNVIQDVNGLKEAIGVEGEVGADGSIIDRLTKVEKTAEGITTTISETKKRYDNDKEEQELMDNVNGVLLDMITTLAEYERVTTKATDDLVIDNTEKTEINTYSSKLSNQLSTLTNYHNTIIEKINLTENANELADLRECKTMLDNAINDLNGNVTTAISDGKINTSDITMMLNFFAKASLRIKEYSTSLDNVSVLGFGGRIIQNLHNVIENATSYSRTISELEETINGETGLKETVSKNSTAIEQNAKEISLKCMKYDSVTSEIKVSDNLIKLDAGKVLMTGTLTWDSLDSNAQENLKGEDGTNATSEYVMLTGDQIFKYDKEDNPDVTSITLKATVYNVDNPKYTWYYKQQGSTTYNKLSNTAQTYSLIHNDAIWGNNNNTITIKVVVSGLSNGQTIEDEMTVVKLYDGIDGVNGNHSEYVKVVGNQFFKYGTDTTQPPTPTSITLTAEQYNFSSTNVHWYYKNSSNSWVELTNYANQNTLVINYNDDIFVGQYATIKYVVNTSVYDIFTITKLVDGADGYTIILTNENHSVPCEADGSYESNALNDAQTKIYVYKGTTEKSFSVTKTDSGCTSTYDTSAKTLNITKLSSNKATVTMKITVDGQTFERVMTITKALRGIQGEVGRGIEILGNFDSVDDLPKSGNPGDAYLINGLLYIWSGTSWGDGVPIRGEQGLPGKDGIDGQTTYTHIKYSNDGKTFTSNNGEDQGSWMGMYTDFSENDSSTFSDYKWFKVEGVDGENGIVANLTNDSHIIPVNNDGSTTSASFTGCETTIQLSHNGTMITSGVTYSYTKSSSVSGTWSNGTYTVTGLSDKSGYVDLKATYNNVGYTKRFTVSKNVDGLTTYTWIKYADNSSGSGLSDSPDGKLYIGFAYNKTTATESTKASDYTWSLIKGEKGDTGEKGATGADGQTTYTWIKYSDYSNGNPCYDTPTSSTQYIGIATNKTTATESSTYTDYKWSKFKGDQGVKGDQGDTGKDAYVVNLSNDNHTFTADSSGALTGTTSITVTVTAFKGVTAITPTIGTLPSVTGLTLSKSGTTITIKATSSMAVNGTFNIPVTVDGITFNKTFSYSKASNGYDGYTVFLSNESEIFNSDSSGNIASAISKTTTVHAYKGATAITPTINTLPSVTGLTLSKSGTTITIKANTGTSLASSGTINIPITVDGLSFTRVFSWTKVKDGQKGNDGKDGKDGSDANIPSWITDWNGTVTTINGSTVLSPKIFAGSVSSGVPTGVAIGKNVFGTSGSYANATGIVGYKNGTKMYHFKDDGTALVGGFTIDQYTIKGSKVGMSSTTSGNQYAFWSGNSTSSSAPFRVDHNGNLYATKAEISGNITGETTLNIGNNVNQNGETISAFAIGKTGNLKIGGYSAHVHSDGLRKGVAEITSLGTIYSCSKTDPNTYAKITEGKIEVCNGGYDSEYGGNFLDRKIVMENGELYITSYLDPSMTTRKKEIAIFGNTIYSNMYDNIEIQETLRVTQNIDSQKHICIKTNAHAYRGVDTDGEQVALAHVGGDNVSRFGYGGWNNDSNSCYEAGSEFMGGNKTVLKAKGSVYLGCNSNKYIRWLLNSDGNYVMRPNDTSKDIMFGTSSYPWKSVTAVSVTQTSDRTLKENIKYISNANTINDDNVTLHDCYEFIKNDLPIATYNYKEDKTKSNKIGFIAQDLLCNADGSDNKVGQLIIDKLKYTEEEGKLTYDTNNLFGVMLSAMQVMSNKIETLEAQIEELKK